MFAVQFLERPPGSRRSEEEEEVEVTRKKRAVAETLTKNLIVRTPEQVSLNGWRFRRLALLTLCARRGLGREWQRAAQQQRDGILGYVFFPCEQEKQSPFYAATNKDEESGT
jgi:hypothetical protein